MARLYADENFDVAVVEELRRLGHDVLRAQEAGQANQKFPDPDVLAFAIAQGRAVITFNYWDYLKLHSRVRPHAGIIICTDDKDVVALAGRIHQAISTCPSLDNQLLRINRPQKP
jgi:predicted nuclease of predicted toxin-antitoxin system